MSTNVIRITGLDHVVFRVKDLDRMSSFYTTVLGATPERQLPEVGLYQFRLGDSLIDLVPVTSRLGRSRGDEPAENAPNVDHVCFRVTPWHGEEILSFLREHGIEAEIALRYGADGDGPSIYITDPEGNGLELKGPPAAAPE